jgi:hypothetical protein
MLQPDETIEVEFRTDESVLSSDVVFTSKRLLVASKDSDNHESMPYRSVTNIKTKRRLGDGRVVEVTAQGRNEKLVLPFADEGLHDNAL